MPPHHHARHRRAATLALAAPAFAHTEVESTSPAGKASTASTSHAKGDRHVHEADPRGTLKVTGPGGGVSKGSGGRDPRKISRVRAGLKGSLAAGRYKVKWHDRPRPTATTSTARSASGSR